MKELKHCHGCINLSDKAKLRGKNLKIATSCSVYGDQVWKLPGS